MECFDADHSGVEIAICLQKLPERLRGNIPASCNGNVRMPGAQIRLQPGSERRFLHAFVDLKQMRVCVANADPNDFRSAFCRKCSDIANRQEERAKLDRAELFAQRGIDIVWNIIEETERQVHLSRVSPAHAANVRIKTCKQLTC